MHAPPTYPLPFAALPAEPALSNRNPPAHYALRFAQRCAQLQAHPVAPALASRAHVAAAISYLVPTVLLLAGRPIFPRYARPCQPWHFPLDRYQVTDRAAANCDLAYCHLALALEPVNPRLVPHGPPHVGGLPPVHFVHFALHALCPNMVQVSEAAFHADHPAALPGAESLGAESAYFQPVRLAQHFLYSAIYLHEAGAPPLP